jgi:hypothetical protein
MFTIEEYKNFPQGKIRTVRGVGTRTPRIALPAWAEGEMACYIGADGSITFIPIGKPVPAEHGRYREPEEIEAMR